MLAAISAADEFGELSVKLGFIALAASAILTTTAAQAAPITFAQFQQLNGTDTFRVTNGTGSNGTLTTIGAPIVNFSFLRPTLQAIGLGNNDAVFNLSGTITTPANVMTIPGPDPITQLVNSGSLSFTRTTAASFGTGSRTNLLTINFTNAVLTGTVGSTSGSLLASTPESVMSFTSDFLNFDDTISLDFALALSSITGGGLGRANASESLRAFTADATGTFSSDPAPLSTVPEPAALGLMGLGLVGVALRRRRKAA